MPVLESLGEGLPVLKFLRYYRGEMCLFEVWDKKFFLFLIMWIEE